MPTIDIQDAKFSPHRYKTLEPNLLHWTRDSLILLWPSIMKDRRIVSFILFNLQISLTVTGSLTSGVPYVSLGVAGIATFFILLDCGCGKYRHRQEPSIDAKKMVFISAAFISIGVISIAPCFLPFPDMDLILLVAVLTSVWWVNAPTIYHLRRHVLVSRGL